MLLVDSHCHLNHLDLSQYQGQLKLALEAAEKSGIQYFLCVCIDLESFPKVIEIANQFPNVYASVGLHPNEKVPEEPSELELLKLAAAPKVVAIGETGLDYYRTEEAGIEIQQERFRRHIRVAKETRKPLIVHTRQAKEDTIDILKEEQASEVRGVMHCFTEDWETAKQAIDLGFYISFSGIITFKSAVDLQEVVKKVPLENMLIETDSPYLAPIPFRGKPNQPLYVKYVAEKIAELKNISVEQVAEVTTKNFFNLFEKATR